MVTADGRAKVLDFGLARMREAHAEEAAGSEHLIALRPRRAW